MSMIPQFLSEIKWSIDTWKRLVFSTIFLALCYFWYSGMMLHHVWDSPFQYKGADPSYWAFHTLGIAEWLCSSYNVALIFSILMLGMFLASAVFYKKRYLTIISGILLLVYQVVFNMKIGYHAHHLFGFQFALLPFYFKTESTRPAIALARILSCMAYFFAGFFKLYHGAWLSFDSFSHVLSNQHAAYLFFNPDGLRSPVVRFVIDNKWIGYSFFVSAMLLQLSFIAGIFSNKFNRMFAVFILLFHVMDWFLMNLGVFMGMCVMMWLFLYTEPKKSV